MAVNDQITRDQYTASGGQTIFSYTFEIEDEAHIKVFQGTGLLTDTLLTIATHYTVQNVGNDAGGTITLVTGATAGDIITLWADPPEARATRWATNDQFDVVELETELDAVQLRMQALETVIKDAIRVAPQDLVVPFAAPFDEERMLLPDRATRINKFLFFDDDGHPAVEGTAVQPASPGDIPIVDCHGCGLNIFAESDSNYLIYPGFAKQDGQNRYVPVNAQIRKYGLGAWAEGSGFSSGSLDTGTFSASTWYYVYLIYNATTGDVDVLTSISGDSPTLPSGYAVVKPIGALRSNGAGSAWEQEARAHLGKLLMTYWNSPIDVHSSTGNTDDANVSVDISAGCPPWGTTDRTVWALVSYFLSSGSTGPMNIRGAWEATDVSPSEDPPLLVDHIGTNGAHGTLLLPVNDATINVRANTGATWNAQIAVRGWGFDPFNQVAQI